MTLVASHRATRSSRTPGRVNTGTVYFVTSQIVSCLDCKRPMRDLVPLGRHAVRWVDGVKRNCVGREVP